MTIRAFSLKWKYGQINQQITTEFCFFSFSPFGVVYHGYLSASFYRFGMITISFRDRWQPVWWQRMPDEWTPLRIMTVIRSTCRRNLLKRKKKQKKQGYSYKLHAMWEKSVEHRLKKCVRTPQKSPLLDSLKKNNKMEKCTALQHHFTKKYFTSQTLLIKHYPK